MEDEDDDSISIEQVDEKQDDVKKGDSLVQEKNEKVMDIKESKTHEKDDNVDNRLVAM